MSDRESLWLADHLVHVYRESPHVDFVWRLRSIAHTQGRHTTPVFGELKEGR